MKIPFNKRRIFRNLLRPYRQLDENCLALDTPVKTYKRVLAEHETPRDSYFRYKIVLVEYDPNPDVIDLPTEEKSSIHTSIQTINGQNVIIAYIVLVRSAFNDADVMQRTERLLCFAHELLFAAQYPQIVRNKAGELSGGDLETGVITPNPLEESDLVCSHYTIARFFHSLEKLQGIKISGRDQLHSFHKTDMGQQYFKKHWEEDHSIDSEVAYCKMVEFFERGLHQPLIILKKCYATCSEANGDKCESPNGDAKKCLKCFDFKRFHHIFVKEGNGDHGFDGEFVDYLCGQADKPLA